MTILTILTITKQSRILVAFETPKKILTIEKLNSWQPFLSDPGVPGVRSMGPDVTKWVSEWVREVVADLIDVTLADKDTN